MVIYELDYFVMHQQDNTVGHDDTYATTWNLLGSWTAFYYRQ